MENPDSDQTGLGPVSIVLSDAISIKEAAFLCRVSTDTIRRWCERHGIGRQIAANTPWRVSKAAVLMLTACDFAALDAFRRGDRQSLFVRQYLDPSTDRGAA